MKNILSQIRNIFYFCSTNHIIALRRKRLGASCLSMHKVKKKEVYNESCFLSEHFIEKYKEEIGVLVCTSHYTNLLKPHPFSLLPSLLPSFLLIFSFQSLQLHMECSYLFEISKLRVWEAGRV